MNKFCCVSILLLFSINFVCAQSLESLKEKHAEKIAEADAIDLEVADLQKQIDEFPGWKKGLVGVVGFDLNRNNDWFANGSPNSSSTAYGIGVTAFANLDQPNFFCRNLLTANLKKAITQLDPSVDESVTNNKVIATNDVLDISSLWGYKISNLLALSTEARYNSTLLSFNRPGKVNVSIGATILPATNLVVVVHPIGYEKNWPGDFVSTIGAKLGISYAGNILPGVAWSSNISAFVPYGEGEATLAQHPLKNEVNSRAAVDAEFDLEVAAISGSSQVVNYANDELLNWTWLNTFSTNFFKGIGIGLNIGLRKDLQIANQARYERLDIIPGDGNLWADDIDQGIQVFYNLGISYTL